MFSGGYYVGIQSATATKVVVTVPAGAQTGPVTVYTDGGGAASPRVTIRT